MRTRMIAWRRTLPAFMLTALMAGAAACSSATGPAVSSADSRAGLTIPASYVSLLQQNQGLSARFSGLMTFKSTGTEVVSQTEFAVPPLAIQWMGPVFNGEVEKGGAGDDIKDSVHGSLTPDGTYITSFSFSRQVLSSTTKRGTFYRVTVRNVPIIAGSGTASVSPEFSKTGADVRKYVEKIEYANGPVVNKQITSITEYISTDWNATAGAAPILKITFSKEAPVSSSDAPAGNSGMK
jgi:hypothetical protein